MTDLTFEQYQKESRSTDLYANVGDGLLMHCLGLTGEVGELAEKIKKVIRNQERVFDETNLPGIEKELGDILWYLAQIATDLDLRLGEEKTKNREKLLDRQKREVIKSVGDER